MYLRRVSFATEKYPDVQEYPFNLPIFRETKELKFEGAVTFFVGENGTGKSTLLEAIARRSRTYIWEGETRTRRRMNPYEHELYRCIRLEWADGAVGGCYFASEIFKHFAQIVDEWASSDPGVLQYFGGSSLMEQSHGQSLMSFFKSRFTKRGIYYLDEPETALSPRRQIELLQILNQAQKKGSAQFIIATHSPILMMCPGSQIFSFDHIPAELIQYDQSEHLRLYRDFLNDPEKYLTR
jgi:predicted ATPase